YQVEVLAVYQTVPVVPDPGQLERVRAGDVDAVTVTSSTTLKNFGDAAAPLSSSETRVISIGPVTSETARALGLRVDAEADPHTIDGLVAAVLETLRATARGRY